MTVTDQSTDHPFVSVIVPTLDEEAAIGACLDSAEDPSAEIIVSDGGSTDSTIEIVRSRAAVRLVTGPSGRGLQLNLGARVALAPRLLFLHADCRLPTGWLSTLRDAVDEVETSLVCFRLCTESDAPGGYGTWRTRWLRLLDLRSRTHALPYGDQGFAMRRDVFDRIGGFPDIPLMEDVVCAKRCRAVGRIQRLPLEIRTSARRFERHPVRARLVTALFPLLFAIGVSPGRLATWYRQVR
jgi:rSAM/selenodomain-associated transferase 2